MVSHNGIPWIGYQGTLIPDVAPHVPVTLTDEAARELLRRSGAYFLRWVSDFDCREETEFWYVIKVGKVSMEELSANTRSKVRRGLKNCSVEPCSAETIANGGYDVYRKAFARYDTFLKPVEKEAFARQILRLAAKKEWEFWCVRDRSGILIAYSQNRIENGSCNYATIKFDPDHLKHYPSYALFFVMNSYYLKERGMRYVNDGARSLSHQTDIQMFLISKFGFRKAFCRLNIRYSPKVMAAVRLLYPFRRLIAAFKHPVAGKLNVLLKHEEIRRSFERG